MSPGTVSKKRVPPRSAEGLLGLLTVVWGHAGLPQSSWLALTWVRCQEPPRRREAQDELRATTTASLRLTHSFSDTSKAAALWASGVGAGDRRQPAPLGADGSSHPTPCLLPACG